ncbi:recombinase RecT [Clostridium botulinum]|nr:recombinase RecT [Clostridium botulinum]
MANIKAVLLKETANDLNTLLETKSEALPLGFNKTRFLQNCLTVIQDTKEIEQCHSATVARTMLKGAFLGLDFLNKECYAIPYGKKLNFQTDYKGEIKLAKKYSINPIKDIYAKVVREEDEFTEEIINGQQTINFKPKAFNNGQVLGVFAVCLFKDGSMIYETMSKEDIENVRQNFSKAKNSAAWTKTYGEMCKKTVLRRLCKLIELDFDTIEQQKTYEETLDFEFKKEEDKKEISPFENEEDIEDVDFEEVKENAETNQE